MKSERIEYVGVAAYRKAAYIFYIHNMSFPRELTGFILLLSYQLATGEGEGTEHGQKRTST